MLESSDLPYVMKSTLFDDGVGSSDDSCTPSDDTEYERSVCHRNTISDNFFCQPNPEHLPDCLLLSFEHAKEADQLAKVGEDQTAKPRMTYLGRSSSDLWLSVEASLDLESK